MIDTFKCICGFDAPSKFALKKHKRFCELGAKGPMLPKERPARDPWFDRNALAERETNYHRFVKG